MNSITKICTHCGFEKKLEDFPNDYRLKSGKKSYCKACFARQGKEYREREAESKKAYRRAYYLSHTDEVKERNRDWACRNADRVRENQTNHKKNNIEKYREYARKATKKWMAAHPEYKDAWRNQNPYKGREYTHKRRVKEAENGGTLTAGEWAEILERYEHRCLRCGRSDVKLAVDHVVPISLGGENSKDNVQPLCKSCNSKKHKKIIDYRPNFS